MTTRNLKSTMRGYIALFVFMGFGLGIMTLGTDSIETIKNSNSHPVVNTVYEQTNEEFPEIKEMAEISEPVKIYLAIRL
jgi:hypothetical protein